LEQAAWESAAGLGPRVVLVEGDAGIGKTALLKAAKGALLTEFKGAPLTAGKGAPLTESEGAPPRNSNGWWVLDVSCDPDEADLPFGLVSQLVWRARGQRSGVPGSAPPPVPTGYGRPPAEVGAEILDFVHAEQAVRPLAVIVDDLHWADRASAQALGFVLRRLGQARFFALVTVAAGAGEEWRRLVSDRELGRSIVLRGLDTAE